MKPREFGPRIFYRQSLINEGVVIMTMMAWLGVVIIIVFSLFEGCPLVTSNEGFGSSSARACVRAISGMLGQQIMIDQRTSLR